MSASRSAGLRLTARSWACYGGAAALIAAAVASRDPVPLFGAVPLLLAPMAALLAAPSSSGPVRVAWRESGNAGTVAIEGMIVVPAEIDARDLEISLPCPPELSERAPLHAASQSDGVGFRAEWWARSPVLLRVNLPAVEWCDALGLAARSLAVEGTPLTIERYPPEVGRLGGIRLQRTIPMPGESRSTTIGDAGEFHGVRPAQAQDPWRRTNWRAWARTGTRYVNEFSLERTGDVLLYLDARPTSLGREIDREIFGISRATAIGIANAFLREKVRVGLAIFGEFVETIPLGSGRSQRLRLRDALLAAQISAFAAPAERGAVGLRRDITPGTTTILVSPLADESASLLIVHLRRRGYPTIVLSPSPISAQLALAPTVPEDRQIVTRVARLYRRQQIARAWREAPVVDWSEYWSLAGFTAFLQHGMYARRHT